MASITMDSEQTRWYIWIESVVSARKYVTNGKDTLEAFAYAYRDAAEDPLYQEILADFYTLRDTGEQMYKELKLKAAL